MFCISILFLLVVVFIFIFHLLFSVWFVLVSTEPVLMTWAGFQFPFIFLDMNCTNTMCVFLWMFTSQMRISRSTILYALLLGVYLTLKKQWIILLPGMNHIIHLKDNKDKKSKREKEKKLKLHCFDRIWEKLWETVLDFHLCAVWWRKKNSRE